MDSYTVVIVLGIVGFFLLAALLLVPINRFLKKEEKASEKWTDEHFKRLEANEPYEIGGTREVGEGSEPGEGPDASSQNRAIHEN
jgi:hypothetical protein